MCLILNETVSSLKLMKELREAIMQEKQQHKGFYTLGYGGRCYIRIPKCIVGCAMHFKESVGHHEGMSFL